MRPGQARGACGASAMHGNVVPCSAATTSELLLHRASEVVEREAEGHLGDPEEQHADAE
jgi:hypothetical protein